MTNHPNRGWRGRQVASSPEPSEITAAREHRGLTQTEAGALIYASLRGWQDWEYGHRRMHPALWRAWKHAAGLDQWPFSPYSPPEPAHSAVSDHQS